MLSQVLLPPLNVILLLAIGAIVGRRWTQAGRVIVALAVALLYIFSTPMTANLLLERLEIYPAIEVEAEGDGETIDAEAIVVLSAGQRYDTREYGADAVDELTMTRLRYAAYLHRRTGLPILASGGHLDVQRNREPLAEMMRRALQTELGVLVRWIEPESTNTRESAAFSAAILREEEIHRALLVTHAWHMPRAVLAFEDTDLTVVPAPTAFAVASDYQWPGVLSDYIPSAGALQASGFALNEWIGLVWQRLHRA